MTRAFDESGLATVPPKEHRWTRNEFHAMGRAGLFDGKRVELIDGKVVEMSPIGPRHWVAANLVEEQVEVFRDPRPDHAAPYGFGYSPPRVLKRGQRIAPLVAPDAQVSVQDLLP